MIPKITAVTLFLFILVGCIPATPDQGASQNVTTVQVERPSATLQAENSPSG